MKQYVMADDGQPAIIKVRKCHFIMCSSLGCQYSIFLS
jgi:hypothetical protein